MLPKCVGRFSRAFTHVCTRTHTHTHRRISSTSLHSSFLCYFTNVHLSNQKALYWWRAVRDEQIHFYIYISSLLQSTPGMHCKASERILYFFLARLPKDRTCTPVCPEALKESKKTSKKALKIEPLKTDTNTLAYCTAVVISHREPGSAQGYIPHRAAPRGQETAENDGG